jgi:cytochrome c biogenesis protein CcmG, thiol:disulfide interchange protein DsbE
VVDKAMRFDEATMTGMRRDIRTFVGTVLVVATIGFAIQAGAIGTGDPAPAFILPTAAGETIALDKLKGQVVYVDFWASWCGPCRRSFPWMNAMQQKYGARGFVVVGVNVDKRRPDAERFLRDTPAAFTVVYDEAGKTPAAYAVSGMPSSYLIDAAGKVVAVESGFRDEQKASLEERIRTLLPAK